MQTGLSSGMADGMRGRRRKIKLPLYGKGDFQGTASLQSVVCRFVRRVDVRWNDDAKAEVDRRGNEAAEEVQ